MNLEQLIGIEKKSSASQATCREFFSEMEKHLNEIRQYFTENPPVSISMATVIIKEITGLERHGAQVRKF